MTAENDYLVPEAMEGTKSLPAPSCGPSGDNLDLKARATIEGHRALGLRIMDPRTGETISL